MVIIDLRAIVTSQVGQVVTRPLFKAATTFLVGTKIILAWREHSLKLSIQAVLCWCEVVCGYIMGLWGCAYICECVHTY